jgi:hypothetical protein
MRGSIRRTDLCVKIILAKMRDVATLFVVGFEKKKWLRTNSSPLEIIGGRCEIRTRGTWLRRPVLYPAELIALVEISHNFKCCYHLWFENGIIILPTNYLPCLFEVWSFPE